MRQSHWEWIQSEFDQFMRENGIEKQFSVPAYESLEDIDHEEIRLRFDRAVKGQVKIKRPIITLHHMVIIITPQISNSRSIHRQIPC